MKELKVRYFSMLTRNVNNLEMNHESFVKVNSLRESRLITRFNQLPFNI